MFYSFFTAGVIFPQIQINNVNGGIILIGTNKESGVFDMKQRTIENTNNLKIFIDKHKAASFHFMPPVNKQ